MAKATMPLPTLSLEIMFLFLMITGGNVNFVNGQKTWCVANPSTADNALLDNLHFACSIVDCSMMLGKKGLCFYPDNIISHASLAMNLYYQTKGRNSWNCHFNGTGLIVLTDPSYGKCKYA